MGKLFVNSVDPDQTPRSAASDLGLHCLPITPLHNIANFERQPPKIYQTDIEKLYDTSIFKSMKNNTIFLLVAFDSKFVQEFSATFFIILKWKLFCSFFRFF